MRRARRTPVPAPTSSRKRDERLKRARVRFPAPLSSLTPLPVFKKREGRRVPRVRALQRPRRNPRTPATHQHKLRRRESTFGGICTHLPLADARANSTKSDDQAMGATTPAAPLGGAGVSPNRVEAPGIEPVRRGRGRPKKLLFVKPWHDGEHFDPRKTPENIEVTSKVTSTNSDRQRERRDVGDIARWHEPGVELWVH